jgi:MoaD family protein
MPVEVKLAANLQKLVGGQKSVPASGSTVGEAIDDLESRHPGIKETIMADGAIHRFVNIYLNDEDIRFLEQLNTKLSEGDTISVLPALAGGGA